MLQGYLLCMTAGILWGGVGIFAKAAYTEGMNPMEVAFWRTTLAWALFAIQTVFSGGVKVAPRDAGYLLAFGVFGVAGLHGFYCLAVSEGGAALAVVLLYTAPAWVALLSFFLLGESMSPAKIAAMAMTIIGVVGVSHGPELSGDTGFGPAAIAFGLLSGFSYALYYIFGKRLGGYPTSALLVYALPAAGLVLWPFTEFTLPTWKAVLACLGMAFVSTYLAFTAYYAGLKRLEASRAAVAATCEPVVAGALAYLLFGETFGPWGYLGSLLIIGAVMFSIWDSMRNLSASSPPSRAIEDSGLPRD